MNRYVLLVAICLLALAGCASPPVPPKVAALPWQDAAFDYHPRLVTVRREDLFRLDPDLLDTVQIPETLNLSAPRRFQDLLALVFGPDLKRFGYVAGQSTTAAETWARQRGDCLSLTVLTYSLAKAMGLAVRIQEVRAPALFDRRDQFDVVNQHVNVLFHRAHRDPRTSELRDVVVDFDPGYASRRPGRALSEDALLARYYNNIATEHLAKGRLALAYAHFKAAIEADPGYAASYGNLAVLYRDAGMTAPAEQLLQRAIALAEQPDVPLHTLHEMLIEQGRMAEAEHYKRALAAARERDPYHWIGLGLRHLNEGEIGQAIVALEAAKDLASGFVEIHRYLATAYSRAGDAAKARHELAVVASLGGGGAGAAKQRLKSKGGVQ
jgi:tetratricopeptide (TPR) repeat protein